jgi:hypothetical protein
MDSGTLSSPEVEAFVKGRFVAVRLEKEHHAAAFESLKVTDFPTTIVLRPDRTEVARFAGAMEPKEFVEKVGAVK